MSRVIEDSRSDPSPSEHNAIDRAAEEFIEEIQGGHETARRVLASAMIVGGVILAGNMLGFVRDLLIANWFGASAKTDAFLVAWTIPETTSTLLMEGAMVYVMIPLLTEELRSHGNVRELVRRSLGPLLLVLAAVAAVMAIAAPLFTYIVAPGLEDQGLAVTCVRLAAPTILFMGAAGYGIAVLRVHRQFVLPAFVYLAYNIGIISVMALTHERFGVESAAIGLTIGSILMVMLQLPSLWRVVSAHVPSLRVDRRVAAELAAFVPIGMFFFFRQSQVYIERFIASFLSPGAISHLNYASKTAQVPATFVLGLAIVSYPAMAHLASRVDLDDFRDTIQRTVRLVIALIVPAIAGIVVFAPGIIHLLYQHGEFTSADTVATADVMRVYTFGLVGQVLVSVAMLPFFAAHKHLWVPLWCVLIGLAVDVVVALAFVQLWGASAIALGNAVGIVTIGVLLLVATNRYLVSLDLRGLGIGALRVCVIAAGAGLLARLIVAPNVFSEHNIVMTSAGLLVTLALYLLIGRLLRVPELEPVLDLLHRRKKAAA